MSALPSLFVSHGAPTLALDPGQIGSALQALTKRIPRPRAIVVASAHWEARTPCVGLHPKPPTIHDFWGFPKALYDIQYPASGAESEGEAVFQQLRAQGIAASVDYSHGLDHGAWVPLRMLYPEADIPVIPLSIQPDQSPQKHLELGRALTSLSQTGHLVLGSGNITHNLNDVRHYLQGGGGTMPGYLRPFCDWIETHLTDGDDAALVDYRRQAPGAVRAHPTEDHILPLFVAYGAAGPKPRMELLHQGEDMAMAMDALAFWPA